MGKTIKKLRFLLLIPMIPICIGVGFGQFCYVLIKDIISYMRLKG